MFFKLCIINLVRVNITAEFCNEIAGNSIIIVANNRQQLAFNNSYQKIKHKKNKLLQLPSVYSWDNFLFDSYQKLAAKDKELINKNQQQKIWELCFKNLNITYNSALLDEVQNTYKLKKTFKIKTAELNKDFIKIFKEYNKLLKTNNYIDNLNLSDLIVKNTDFKKNKFFIYGFNRLTPEQEVFLRKINYKLINPKVKNTDIKTKSFTNEEDEIIAAALWAKKNHTKNPNAEIAVVVPNLAKIKNTLTYHLNNILITDEHNLLETHQKPYNISLGMPLFNYPLIKYIHSILLFTKQFNENKIDIGLANKILTSPFIKGYEEEKFERNSISYNLNTLETKYIDKDIFNKLAQDCNLLLDILKKISDSNMFKGDKNHSHWHNIFNIILSSFLGNNKELSKSQYQLIKKYYELSLDFSKFGKVIKKASFYQALDDLAQLLQKTIFQPSHKGAKIHILGELEAEGLYFDKVWIMGLNNETLPKPVKNYKFIPFYTAKKYAITHCDYAEVYSEAKKTLVNFQNLALDITFSYSRLSNARECNASQMIDFENKIFNIEDSYLNEYKTIKLAKTKDISAPAVKENEVRRGVTILKNQALCPFKGFAMRLDIDEYKETNIGLDKIQKGKITHKILEAIYKEIKNQSQLKLLTLDEKEFMVNKHIDSIFNKYELNDEFAELEKQKLTTLLINFLLEEEERDYFEVVDLEATQKVKIGKLEFNIRLDRIDKNKLAKKVIFDYKTGKVELAGLCSELIKEPQLAIYAVSNKVDAVGYIQIKSNNINYSGFSSSESLITKKTKPGCNSNSWQKQIIEWNENLNKIADLFSKGYAEVKPLNNNSCYHCNLELLCRINCK